MRRAGVGRKEVELGTCVPNSQFHRPNNSLEDWAPTENKHLMRSVVDSSATAPNDFAGCCGRELNCASTGVTLVRGCLRFMPSSSLTRRDRFDAHDKISALQVLAIIAIVNLPTGLGDLTETQPIGPTRLPTGRSQSEVE